MSEQDFAVIIRNVGGGDEQALATLYDATSPLLLGMALRIVGDTAAAEDVLYEAYAQARHRAAEYDDRREAPLTWLVMLTRRLALDWLRSSKRRPEIFSPANDTGKTSDGEVTVPTTELQKITRAALDTLSPEERNVLDLSFYAGLNSPQVAARLEITVCEAKARMRSGMMKLHEQLGRMDKKATHDVAAQIRK